MKKFCTVLILSALRIIFAFVDVYILNYRRHYKRQRENGFALLISCILRLAIIID
nr:MAG TPA: hypothetical protein [Inoviridae sp.]